MTMLLVVVLVIVVWFLARIARHTADALDRQAAMQVELAALNRRLAAIERRLDETQQDPSGG